MKNRFDIGYILIDLTWVFPTKPSELKISLSVKSYHEKIAEYYWNCYVAEKRSFETIKDIDPKY